MKKNKTIILPLILTIITVILIKYEVITFHSKFTGLPQKIDNNFQFVITYIALYVAFYSIFNFPKFGKKNQETIPAQEFNTSINTPLNSTNSNEPPQVKILAIPALLALILTIFAKFGILMPKNLRNDIPYRIENLGLLFLYFLLLYIIFFIIFNFSYVLKSYEAMKSEKK